MATFVAIIMGTVCAGFLKTAVTDAGQTLEAQRLWIGSAICIGIAIAGTCTSLMVRRIGPANAGLKLTRSSFSIPKPTLDFLRHDTDLLCAILASSVFWLVSGIAIQAVNSLGRVQLALTDDKTSILAGVIAIGIAVGAVVAGKISRGKTDFRIVRVGMWGIAVWLIVLSISPGGVHLLKFGGSIPVLILLGAAAGFFAIPLQVFIQSRPPDNQKGQMIAVMNQANFIAILLSGVIYSLFDRWVKAQAWPRSYIFAMMAMLILPMAIFYRPKNSPG
jgi:acyl-[acyl-carrier-protein]-phospholipid O-acyltransferase/long-chain-fatty-acid--[acyl-carrier-protein] ligase